MINDFTVVFLQSSSKSSKQPGTTVRSEISEVGGAEQCDGPPAGCAASWAVNFDNLLSSKSGLAAFTVSITFTNLIFTMDSHCKHLRVHRFEIRTISKCKNAKMYFEAFGP